MSGAASSSFFQSRSGGVGETVTASVLAPRRDSSPVINRLLNIRILNRFWIERLNTTTGLKPRRAEEFT